MDWNQTMLKAAHAAATSPLLITRNAAIVQAAVFDAVNGIEPRYSAVHVQPAAPRGASRRAAAVQAAYATLVSLYPTQQSTFDAQRAVSLAETLGDWNESPQSVAGGIQWGQKVAEGILAWRSADGFTPAPPPFIGSTSTGMWRPTPPALAAGAAPQFARMTTWAINSPVQFRPGGPPPLNSARYASDFNETKAYGSLTSAIRTSDQTIYAFFWQSVSAVYALNNLAGSLINERNNYRRQTTLLENARLFALLNISIADAAIACWDAKYTFSFWRPVTAIPLADDDENPATLAEPTWSPLFATPNHPEYPSAHSAFTAAGAVVLARAFGQNANFEVRSDTLAAVRSFKSFRDMLEEVQNARIVAGIHFRSATTDGGALGLAVGNYVLQHALLPLASK
jgi:hypothetical protein